LVISAERRAAIPTDQPRRVQAARIVEFPLKNGKFHQGGNAGHQTDVRLGIDVAAEWHGGPPQDLKTKRRLNRPDLRRLIEPAKGFFADCFAFPHSKSYFHY
jgi:hypothetical protein